MFKSIWFYLFDPKGGRKLSNTIIKLSAADSLAERRRIVEEHPELLSQEAQEILNSALVYEKDEETIQLIVSLQKFLRHPQPLSPTEKMSRALRASASLNLSTSEESQNEEE